MIVLLLSLLAHADDGLDAREVEATATIEACQAAPHTCRGRETQLAEAFLVRATAAATLRGEVDCTAAANARRLAPDLVEDWTALLPSDHGTPPEPWVAALADDEVAPPTPPPLPPESTGSLDLRRDAVVEVGGTLKVVGQTRLVRAHGEASGRFRLGRDMGLRADLWVHPSDSSRATGNLGEDAGTTGLKGPLIDTGLALGPAWWQYHREAGTNVVSISGSVSWITLSPEARYQLDDLYGLEPPPPALGLGLVFRDVAQVQVGASPHHLLHLEGAIAWQHRREVNVGSGGDDPLTTSRLGRGDPNEAVSDQLRLDMAIGWDGWLGQDLLVGAGVRVFATMQGPRYGFPIPGAGPELRLGWGGTHHRSRAVLAASEPEDDAVATSPAPDDPPAR